MAGGPLVVEELCGQYMSTVGGGAGTCRYTTRGFVEAVRTITVRYCTVLYSTQSSGVPQSLLLAGCRKMTARSIYGKGP